MTGHMAVLDGSPFANNVLSNTKDVNTWAKESNLEWEINASPLMYKTEGGILIKDDSKKVLYRSDNSVNFGVVGKDFKVVQPRKVLDFYSKLSKRLNINLEAAGYVKRGALIWGLADLGNNFRIKGQDEVRSHLMFSTANDGTRATNIHFISKRIVCNNMLNFAFNEASNSPYHVRIPHMVEITEQKEAAILEDIIQGVDVHWKEFEKQSCAMAETGMTKDAVLEYFTDLMSVQSRDTGELIVPDSKLKTIEKLLKVYEGGMGQNTRSAKGTLWGALNAVTRYIDHETNYRSEVSRIQTSQFGTGNSIKNKAFKQAAILLKTA
jgi:phage/plasmid-like protein (TIGR03299 family)